MAEIVSPSPAQPGATTPPPLAPVHEGSKNGASNLQPNAADRAVQFGGNKGGKPRQDNLVPGSEAARIADQKKQTERMREYRANKRAQNPPALPPVLPANTAAINPAPPPPGSALVVSPAPPIAWQPETLKPLVAELLPLIEQEDVKRKTAKAAAAKLPASVLKEIEKDSHWPGTAKTMIEGALPAIVAKWMNKFGISAEYKDEIILGGAVIMIWQGSARVSAKLDELIATQKQIAAQNQQLNKEQLENKK